MLSKIVYTLTLAVLSVNTVLGAALPSDMSARAILTATNSYAACNCPNNCSHKEGSSCKYYGGVSDNSDTISGHCTSVGGQLVCQA